MSKKLVSSSKKPVKTLGVSSSTSRRKTAAASIVKPVDDGFFINKDGSQTEDLNPSLKLEIGHSYEIYVYFKDGEWLKFRDNLVMIEKDKLVADMVETIWVGLKLICRLEDMYGMKV